MSGTGAPTGPTDGGFDFKRLLLKAPAEEFVEFARDRVRAAERLGGEDLAVLLEAVELGRRLLAREGRDDPPAD